jgi:predicted Zn-dependent peptidase
MKNDHVQTHIFSNGFRMIYQKPITPLPVTSIYVFCDVGSALETDGIRGISHFVEHMCFKGTTKIPDSHDILLSYDNIGAYFNAFTEKQYTTYTVNCQDIYVKNCTDILADMMNNSTFHKKEFDKEQKVVVEENIRNENDIYNILSEKIDAIIYNGCPFQYPIDTLSYHPTNDHLKHKDVLDWYHTFYLPSKMVYSVVSNLSFKYIKHIIQSSIFHQSRKPKSTICYTPYIELRTNLLQTVLHKKKGISTHLIKFGFRVTFSSDDDIYILKLLKNVLNGMSGRLFTLLREKNGLTYRSTCSLEYLNNIGSFLVTAETIPKNTLGKNGVLSLLTNIWIDLKKNGITNQELKTAKIIMKSQYLNKSGNNDILANYNGKKYLLHKNDPTTFLSDFIPYNDLYSKTIKKITVKDIKTAIDQYFKAEHLVVGIIGENVPSEKEVNTITHSIK